MVYLWEIFNLTRVGRTPSLVNDSSLIVWGGVQEGSWSPMKPSVLLQLVLRILNEPLSYDQVGQCRITCIMENVNSFTSNDLADISPVPDLYLPDLLVMA